MKTKPCIVLFTLFLLPFCAFAQKFVLQGALIDSTGGPLEAATVMLLHPVDSALLAFSRTQTGGVFEFKSQPAGKYLLRATYFGYRNLNKSVDLGGANPVVDLGILQMESKNTLLREVEITGEANPVTLKKDTIEFNAGSFKVKQNGVVEDLLKKLPGVEVERDGTVKAQGEEVKNVLVDGKKFFGTDPKVATKNLPADAVNKVQVYDKKSEQAVFSGIDDGQREKTINLQLKDDKKKGWFGRLFGGGGSDLKDAANAGRYESGLSLNRFKPKQQLSFLGQANNVNDAGFSMEDYMQFSGAMRQMMSGRGGAVRFEFNTDNMNVPINFGDNEGFLRTAAGGVNFNQEYGNTRKGELNGSYFYNQPNKQYARAITQQSFLPTGTFTTLENSTEENQSDSHRFNLTLDQKIDSFNSVQLNSAFLYNETSARSTSNSESFRPGGLQQNAGDRTFQSDLTGANWNGNLLWRHKFPKKGRTFSTNFSAGLNRSESEANSFSENRFFDDGGHINRLDTIAQDQEYRNDALSLGARTSFTEPLGNRRYLELSYQYNLSDNNADKKVYDRSGGERNFDPLLSNAYDNRFDFHRAGAGLRFNRKAWNGSVGLDAQSATLDGEVRSGQGAPVRQTFRHLLPRMDFNYEFAQSSNLRLNYGTNITAPTVQQLQPVPDVSDPLNIQDGNPGLRPEYAHNLNLHYSNFNPETMKSFFSGLFFTYTSDRIVNAQTVDSLFVRHYRPVNTRSDYRLFGNFAFGFRLKKLKSRLNLRTEGATNRGQNFINNRENFTQSVALTQALNLEYNPADWITASLGAELTWNQTSYSIDRAFNQEFVTQNYSGELNLEMPKGFTFNTSFNTIVNSGRADGFNQSIPIWNASIAKSFLKGKRGEVSLSVRDLLNRNVGIHRSANLNYIQDERVSSLGRYAMLRLTYSLNKIGGPGGGPGMRIRMLRH